MRSLLWVQLNLSAKVKWRKCRPGLLRTFAASLGFARNQSQTERGVCNE
jgi:hypothetical protein